MMSRSRNGQNESLQPGLLQPGVVEMLNQADPKLLSQEVLDRNRVTSVTGVTEKHFAAGLNAGRILLHPSLETYNVEPTQTVLHMRTANPNHHEGTTADLAMDILESVSKAVISYLKKGEGVRQSRSKGFKDRQKRSKLFREVPKSQF